MTATAAYSSPGSSSRPPSNRSARAPDRATIADVSLTDAVRRELLGDPEVTEGAHRFGGVVFHLRGHEIGHLHGETVADLPLPAHLRHELLVSGRIGSEHVEDGSDWVSRRVDGPADVAAVVELFRISYDHVASLPPRVQEAEEPDDDGRAGWRRVMPSFLRRRAS